MSVKLDILQKEANEIFEEEVKTDLKYINFLLKQGRTMFLVPWDEHYQKRTRIIGFLITLVLIPVFYEFLTLRYPFFSNLPMSCLVMDIVMFFLSFVWLIVFVTSQSRHYNNWKNLKYIANQTEILMNNLSDSKNPEEKFYLQYFILHVIFLIPHLVQLFRWLKACRYSLVISYIGFRVVHYWSGFTSLLICQWLNFMTRRYECLNLFLNRRRTDRVLVVDQAITELRLMGKILNNLRHILKEINNIFSIHLFFIILVVICLTLHGISFALVFLDQLQVCLDSLLFVSLFLANLCFIVLSFERLGRKKRDIIITCLFFQEEMNSGRFRDEITLLISYMKNMTPKLSASGFFDINLQLLSTYISTVFSYLIIILQFNMTFI